MVLVGLKSMSFLLQVLSVRHLPHPRPQWRSSRQATHVFVCVLQLYRLESMALASMSVAQSSLLMHSCTTRGGELTKQ